MASSLCFQAIRLKAKLKTKTMKNINEIKGTLLSNKQMKDLKGGTLNGGGGGFEIGFTCPTICTNHGQVAGSCFKSMYGTCECLVYGNSVTGCTHWS